MKIGSLSTAWAALVALSVSAWIVDSYLPLFGPTE
jgi:hypothetical protein